MGLAFKPNIDDLRESLAVEIVSRLAAATIGRVLAVEPHVQGVPADLAGLPASLVGIEEALRQADIVVLLVDHSAFAEIDPRWLAGKTVIDTRGLWRHLPKQTLRSVA